MRGTERGQDLMQLCGEVTEVLNPKQGQTADRGTDKLRLFQINEGDLTRLGGRSCGLRAGRVGRQLGLGGTCSQEMPGLHLSWIPKPSVLPQRGGLEGSDHHAAKLLLCPRLFILNSFKNTE